MRTLGLLLLTALGACGGGGPATPATPAAAPPGAAARAQALEAAAATLEKLDGRWQRGAEPSSWAAYFERGQLRFLDERVTPPGGAVRRNRYYFDNGQLFYFAGEAPASATVGGGADARAPTVPVQAEFSGQRALAAVRIEHYGAVPLTAAEAAAILAQARELASIVTSAHGARGTH
jgi:hypothetical protein